MPARLVRFRANPDIVRVSLRRHEWGWLATVALRVQPDLGYERAHRSPVKAMVKALRLAYDEGLEGVDLSMGRSYHHPFIVEEERVMSAERFADNPAVESFDDGPVPETKGYTPSPPHPVTKVKARPLKDGQLTAGSLIRLLQRCPADAGVWSDGCDCVGEAKTLVFNEDENTVTIERLLSS